MSKSASVRTRRLSEAASWQSWEMEELSLPGGRRSESAPENADAGEAPSEAARETGYNEGLETGRKEGYHAGFEQGRKEGHEQGLREGREQAARDSREAIRKTLEPLNALLHNSEAAFRELDEDVASDLVDLALSVGQQLARDALRSKPERVLNIVRELLHGELMLSARPRLWLHPRDLTLVSEHLDPEIQAAGWTLQPDDTMTRGGCRLTSDSGEVDASWEARWDSVKRQVRQRRTRKPKESEQ